MTDETEQTFDMSAAQEALSQELFPSAEQETQEETDDEQESVEEETSEDASDEDETQESEDEEQTTDERQAPQSWQKEMREAFLQLDPKVQDYIELREEQMREGLEQDRGDADLGRNLRYQFKPYQAFLKSQNTDEVTAARNLLDLHYRLATSPEDMRAVLMDQLANYYGLSKGEQTEVDPEIKALKDELYGIKSHLTATQARSQQEAHNKVVMDVEKFASDPKHSYFDEISEDIAGLIHAGYSLEDAYEKAVWANPVTRQKEIERVQKQRALDEQEKKKQEAEKAKKAKSVNVRTRDTNKTPTEPVGTMEDTMRDVYREIQNRS